MLIRAIYHPDVGMINGPCKVVDHILAQYEVASIAELVGEDGPLDDYKNHRGFHLVETDDTAPDEKIYSGPRIGLNATTAPEWVNKPYRFCRRFKLIKKEKRKLQVLAE